MQGKLSVIKNIIWAVCIILCLLALLVGLLFSLFVKYGGEQEKNVLILGQSEDQQVVKDPDQPDNGAAVSYGDGTLRTLTESQDGGQAYIDSLTFICDSALIGMRDYGLLTGGTATTQVWGSSAGNIPASSIAQCTIRYPGDGSEISAAEAAMIARPGILVISLGMDGLSQVDKDSFIAAYEELVKNIMSVSPDSRVICCSLSSVTPSYSGTDGITAMNVLEANGWIQQVCMDTGAYYADAGSAVRDSAGNLLNDYASSNGKSLNSEGVNKILEYLRGHALS